MDISEIVDFARNFAVLVRVQGPDPKGLKMRKHAFHLYNSGTTTLSASGLRLPDSFSLISDSKSLTVVVTVASVVEPFLSLRHRNIITQGKPELVPGVQIDVMVEGNKESNDRTPSWLSAELLALADVSSSSGAVLSVVQASIGSSDSWEVGWSLALNSDDPQTLVDATQTQMGLGWSTAKLAFLGISTILPKDQIPNVKVSPSVKRGDFLLAIGSPFGALSPMHFFNSVSEGSVANSYSYASDMTSLLMADIRCLPGMEGGPVFGKDASLIGILARPLRQKTSGAEVQLVIPWESIVTACSDLLHEEPQNAQISINHHKRDVNTAEKMNISDIADFSGGLSPNEKALKSVCLITIDDGVWASGVLLNKKGLILTNAHLLEPWRFQKTSTSGNSKEGYKLNWMTIQRRIRVRLDHMDPWMWCDAKVVYVSKGPLDFALLQLETVSGQLNPIVPNFTCPEPGSKTCVIGHGLFGPRCELSPSASVGVVAKVVEAKGHLPYTSQHVITQDHFPAMLETTAAVHPGGSGGIVVNSDGQMIGLVTSNARHGGGKTIPHLNFSIPCAILEPIFRFSEDMLDFSILEDLDRPNEQLSSVWALMPPLAPKPDPSLPKLHHQLIFDTNKDGKGSRFAKFLEETQDIFGKQGQLGKNEIFTPSKL